MPRRSLAAGRGQPDGGRTKSATASARLFSAGPAWVKIWAFGSERSYAPVLRCCYHLLQTEEHNELGLGLLVVW